MGRVFQTEQDIWRDLSGVARWAPSPHNTQPWKLQPRGDRSAYLLLDRQRTLPKEDLTGCFIDCAMGCFIESIRIAAANRGLGLEATLREPDQGDLTIFAELELAPDDNIEPIFSDEVLERRQTSRLSPAPERLADHELTILQRAAEPYGQNLTHVVESDTIDALMRINLEAVIEDLNSHEYHDEIVSWFRYRESTARRLADGLSARCMQIPPLEFLLLAVCPWTARLPILGRGVRRIYQARLGTVPQLAVLSGPFWNRAAATQAGGCLMRLWLHMTEMGLYIHPFGNMVTNATASREIAELMGQADIWIVFRLGRTPQPPRSHRLSVEEIICE